MTIPVGLLAAVIRISSLNYGVVWMGLVIANGQSKGQCKTVAKYVNTWLKRSGKAASIDGSVLQDALAAFLIAAPNATQPPYPVQ